LEREERFKDRKGREQVLQTWGVDKTSGMEEYPTQLMEWTIRTLLESESEKEVEKKGKHGSARNDHRGWVSLDSHVSFLT